MLPDLGTGGAQRVMCQIAHGLAQSGIHVTLVIVANLTEVIAPPPNVAVERVGATRLRSGLPGLVATLRRLRPEVIVSVMGYLNFALTSVRPLLGSARLVIREANRLSVTHRALPGPLARLGYRHLYPRADAVIAPTARIRAEIIEAAAVAADRVVEIPNPVATPALRASAARTVRVPGPGTRIVAAGRLVPAKGFDRLIEAMARLAPDTHLTIHGEGPERPALEGLAAYLGLAGRVALAGYSHELPAAIAGADVFALPSRVEGLPNVGLEALALGTPVVAWDSAEMDGVWAKPGAIAIASDLDGFTALISAITPTPVMSPRPNLLGDRYDIDGVLRRWIAALSS